MAERIYITTPLYYVNAEPHLGSTYTNVVCDSFARFHRQRGVETFLLTGTDEHGEKIAQAATAAGKTPKDFVDEVSGKFRAVWDSVGIRYDHFMRTSDPHHVAFVQDVLSRIHASGDIYFGAYEGLYCVGCERLYTEKELVDGLCPQHLTKPVAVQEPNYFFRMEKYQDQLRAHIEANPDFIRPEGYRSEALAMLREPIGDLCISRPKARLTWGIEMPFDTGYVTYVWFDALLNYVSGLEARGIRAEFWPTANHFIGKDILKTHAVFWPTMLLAAGYPIYRHLNVHGFWTSGGQKMSKSLGNVVEPLALRDTYGMDAVRYYLLREMAFGNDADFTESALVTRINADLANGLGNLASRTLAMMNKYFASRVQPLQALNAIDRGVRSAFESARATIGDHVQNLAFHRALEVVWSALDTANGYIVHTQPFTLAKQDSQLPRVGSILHNCLEALRVSAQLIAPFLPDTAERLRIALNLDHASFDDLDLAWGAAFLPGHVVGEPISLFPRIETQTADGVDAPPRKLTSQAHKPVDPFTELLADLDRLRFFNEYAVLGMRLREHALPIWNTAQFSSHSIEKREHFATKEIESEFPYVAEIACVRLWTLLESFIDDYSIRVGTAVPVLIDFSRLPHGKGGHLDVEVSTAQAAMAVIQKALLPVPNGINRYEMTVRAFGLVGEVDQMVAQRIDDLAAIRNLVIHQNGKLDAKLIKKWRLNARAGDRVVLPFQDFQRQLGAVGWYACEIVRRGTELLSGGRASAGTLSVDQLQTLRDSWIDMVRDGSPI